MSFTGRTLVLAIADTASGSTYTTIAGSRNHSITMNNAIVDSTTKDDAGIRQLLDEKVLMSLTCTIDGIAKDSTTLKTLRDAASTGKQYNMRVTTAGDNTAGVTYTGAWHVTSFEERGAHDGLQEYAATLESAGTIAIAALT